MHAQGVCPSQAWKPCPAEHPNVKLTCGRPDFKAILKGLQVGQLWLADLAISFVHQLLLVLGRCQLQDMPMKLTKTGSWIPAAAAGQAWQSKGGSLHVRAATCEERSERPVLHIQQGGKHNLLLSCREILLII